jgi:hypothetical protein
LFQILPATVLLDHFYVYIQQNKTYEMKTNSVQQEILLIKNTSFSRRQLYERDTMENGRSLPQAEWLESACWSGWLDAMLPEMVDISTSGKSLYLWQIMQAKSSLCIELGESPKASDVQYSINPYAVIATACYE